MSSIAASIGAFGTLLENIQANAALLLFLLAIAALAVVGMALWVIHSMVSKK